MLRVSAFTGAVSRRFMTTSCVPWQPECGPVTAVSANWAPIDTMAAFTLPNTADRSKKNSKIAFILVTDNALFT